MGATASIVTGVSSAAAGYAQAGAISAKGAYDQQIAESNSRLASMQAEEATARGDKAASQALKQGRQLRGAQRAAAAASGVDIGTGSALALQQETTGLSQLDALTIKNNAAREAHGYQVQAVNYTSQADMTSLATANEARNTLLTGGLRALTAGAETGAKWEGSKISKFFEKKPAPADANAQYGLSRTYFVP